MCSSHFHLVSYVCLACIMSIYLEDFFPVNLLAAVCCVHNSPILLCPRSLLCTESNYLFNGKVCQQRHLNVDDISLQGRTSSVI